MTPAPNRNRAALAALAVLCAPAALSAAPDEGDTERVSVDPSGGDPDFVSEAPALPADGRYVAFESEARNLVPGDTNFARDVFVYDRLTDTTERVSVTTSGGQGNGHSSDAAITADGRYVVFTSAASNLVSDDTNGLEDVFLHDRDTGATTRVSLNAAGEQSSGLSYHPDIAPDGRYVAFSASAGDLVAGDTNGQYDVFVRDLATGTNTRVSVCSTGVEGDGPSAQPVVSEDGRVVAFESLATTLVLGDANGHQDVFAHDLATGETTLVSVSSGGIQGNSVSQLATISDDGRYVAFESLASTLAPGDLNVSDDVFLHDRLTGATTLRSVASSGEHGNYISKRPSLSSDGRLIAFESWSSNLVPGDTNAHLDAFVHDQLTGLTRRVSLDSSGGESNGHSYRVSISGDGRFVGFQSDATNLVPNDTNVWTDVFVHDSTGEPVGTAYCFGDGTGTACPCANAGASGQGCANSTGYGGRLVAAGSAGVQADDLLLLGNRMLPGQPALLFAGTTAVNGGDGIAFGDGLRCAGGSVQRLGAAPPDANGIASWGPGLIAQGNWTAGDLRRFQTWYRDPAGSPCGSGFNLSNGLEVTFVP